MSDKSNLLAILPKSNPLFQNVVLKVWCITGLVGYGKGAEKQKPCSRCSPRASAVQSWGRKWARLFPTVTPPARCVLLPSFTAPVPFPPSPLFQMTVRAAMDCPEPDTRAEKSSQNLHFSDLHGIPTTPWMAVSS